MSNCLLTQFYTFSVMLFRKIVEVLVTSLRRTFCLSNGNAHIGPHQHEMITVKLGTITAL